MGDVNKRSEQPTLVTDLATLALLGVWLLSACSSSNSSGMASGGSSNSGGTGATSGAGTGGSTETGGNGGVCVVDPSLTCNGNTVPYSCSGADEPEQPPLQCVVRFLASGGKTGHCCSLGAGAGTCQADSGVACDASHTGYSCAGNDTPAQSNTALVCLSKGSSNGKNGYCCSTYASSECSLQLMLTGCGAKYAFYCKGNAKPSDAEPALVCDPGQPALNDQTAYCCAASSSPVASTCMRDDTVPCGSAQGYSCTGADTPSDANPQLNCGTPAMNGGKTGYCCLE